MDTGVVIIISKLSDIFGRKTILITVVILFAIFSAACGAAQTIDQLIIFRALQGVGGAGNFAVCSVILLELVPSHKYAKYTSSVSVVYSFSLLLGPVLGGAISDYTTWRWIFLINVPPAILTAVVILLSMPNGFPHHGNPRKDRPNAGRVNSRQYIQRLDYLGTILLLVATVFLVAALEEADLAYSWSSPFVISLLIISGLAWIAFLLWERHITLEAKVREPMFPWRFLCSRVWVGMLLNAFFLGSAWFCTIFQLPQRMQIVNGISPVQAGLQFIPFTLAAPLGSVIAPTIAKMTKIPPIYLVLFAALCQVIGLALISTLPNSRAIIKAQYGYEIIAGFGCGINITLLVLMTPFCVQERDKGMSFLEPNLVGSSVKSGVAVAMGSVTQFRVMGGAIGLAIVTAAFNGLARVRLESLITPSQLAQLLQYPATIETFPVTIQDAIRVAFAEGYTLQAKILAGLAAGQFPATLLMWQKEQIKV
ncbi:putative Major facilitator superfamily (MFS) profile domain-containing protein [Seiridium unicorne]|uniref:Major facilitator superfamily (MFS) profile domain-containing protein n=1 Tax=Seiridium unicorne TaxID=138068 RepID=A0ABR2UFX8_9PEZI